MSEEQDQFTRDLCTGMAIARIHADGRRERIDPADFYKPIPAVTLPLDVAESIVRTAQRPRNAGDCG